MANVFKLRKGLDIHLKGTAIKEKGKVGKAEEYALIPDDFTGVTPKLAVHEGDKVRAGDALFVNKAHPEVRFSSPVSGTVTAVVRGERRKVLCVKVKADAQQQYVDFGKRDVSSLNGEEVKKAFGGNPEGEPNTDENKTNALRNVEVFTDSKKLVECVIALMRNCVSANLLMMSSGNFDGIDFAQLADEII